MSASSSPRLLLTCEHGGNRVPAAYRRLFAGSRAVLDSHRGLDIGARDAARFLQRHLAAPLICATVTRLLVDLNRSVTHPGLLSEWTCDLDDEDKRAILSRHYHPYRRAVERWIGTRIRRGETVFHLAVHSFTPVLDGRRRQADVGLLYDPARAFEKRLCAAWQAGLADVREPWKIRRNYPYRGTSDGQVVALRRLFPASRYAGVELELNQATLADRRRRRALLRDLVATLPAWRRA
jgi:predicted N-formylglutamate amidohydrolase